MPLCPPIKTVLDFKALVLDFKALDDRRQAAQALQTALQVHGHDKLACERHTDLYVVRVVWETSGQLHKSCEGILTPYRLDGGAR